MSDPHDLGTIGDLADGCAGWAMPSALWTGETGLRLNPKAAVVLAPDESFSYRVERRGDRFLVNRWHCRDWEPLPADPAIEGLLSAVDVTPEMEA